MKVILLTTFLFLQTIISIGQVTKSSFTPDTLIKKSPPTKEVTAYIKSFCKIIKKNSLYSDSLDWESINKELKHLSLGMSSINDAQALCGFVLSKLRALGDSHSFILTKNWAEISSKQNLDERQPTAKILDSNIGYVFVPGFSSISDTAIFNFAYKIQSLIMRLDSERQVKGWIIDLRENTGGNMYPMIAGLGPLIDSGTLGYFVSRHGKSKYRWYYKNGACGPGIATTVRIKDPYFLKNKGSKIAVLIGQKTASSGEMTAISFIGKSNVKLFGQSSAGYTTSNQGFKLSDGSYLYLAVSFVSDRNGKKYLQKISPDILVSDKEEIIKIAEKWIEYK